MTHRREGALAWWASSGEVVRAWLRWLLRSSLSLGLLSLGVHGQVSITNNSQ